MLSLVLDTSMLDASYLYIQKANDKWVSNIHAICIVEKYHGSIKTWPSRYIY